MRLASVVVKADEALQSSRRLENVWATVSARLFGENATGGSRSARAKLILSQAASRKKRRSLPPVGPTNGSMPSWPIVKNAP